MRVTAVLLVIVPKPFQDFAQSAEEKQGYSNVETCNGGLLRNYYVLYIVTVFFILFRRCAIAILRTELLQYIIYNDFSRHWPSHQPELFL
jgi:hypothetical protein